MKILLISAGQLKKTGITGQLYPPLGLLYLAAYVRNKIPGLEIQIIDGNWESHKALKKKALCFLPDIIGISYTTQSATGAYRLINEIKENNKNIKIVVGGPHATIFPREAFKKSLVDIVVVGEGEETFYHIIDCLNQGKSLVSIPGTLYKNDGMVLTNPSRPLIKDLDTIPFPARDLIDLKRYPGYFFKLSKADTSILSSRGCPFNCIYCSNPVWKAQKPWYRMRSPKNVVAEIKSITENYGITDFFDQADEFNGNIKWAKSLCKELINSKANISFKAQMRVDNVDQELGRLLKQAGMSIAFFGIESCNQNTLNGINKKLNLEQVDQTLGIMTKNDLMTCGLFMAFNAWEDQGKLKFENYNESYRTVEYIKKLVVEKKINYFFWSMTTPYPGTELYRIALKYNLIPSNVEENWEYFDASNNFLMQLPGVNESEWKKLYRIVKKIQTGLLINSGLIKIRLFPFYLKKVFFIMKRIAKRQL